MKFPRGEWCLNLNGVLTLHCLLVILKYVQNAVKISPKNIPNSKKAAAVDPKQ